MKYKVTIHKKALKDIKKAPTRIQRKFDLLVDDLENSGPVQSHWPNYSRLGKAPITVTWIIVGSPVGDMKLNRSL